MEDSLEDLGVVVIGRNEGERLRACLLSLQPLGSRVYVDSGSTDSSLSIARELGFDTVELEIPPGFTAARARNAGLARLTERHPALTFVQMVDGDCEVAPRWLDAARTELLRHPTEVAVFGRRREREPDRNVYHLMCDDEWDVPIGVVNSCGGDAMFRIAPLLEVGGYTEDLIAGEEPDLCLRLRRNRWTIRRIDHEMTLHDVAISGFGQWWRRAQRGGHAFADLAHRHGSDGDPGWTRQLKSITVWTMTGFLASGLLIGGSFFGRPTLMWSGTALAGLFIAQLLRIAWRRMATGMPLRKAVPWACLIMLGKFAQFQGILLFHWRRLAGSRTRIIEYKSRG